MLLWRIDVWCSWSFSDQTSRLSLMTTDQSHMKQEYEAKRKKKTNNNHVTALFLHPPPLHSPNHHCNILLCIASSGANVVIVVAKQGECVVNGRPSHKVINKVYKDDTVLFHMVEGQQQHVYTFYSSYSGGNISVQSQLTGAVVETGKPFSSSKLIFCNFTPILNHLLHLLQ